MGVWCHFRRIHGCSTTFLTRLILIYALFGLVRRIRGFLALVHSRFTKRHSRIALGPFDFFGGGGGAQSSIQKTTAERYIMISLPKTPSFPLIECEPPRWPNWTNWAMARLASIVEPSGRRKSRYWDEPVWVGAREGVVDSTAVKVASDLKTYKYGFLILHRPTYLLAPNL